MIPPTPWPKIFEAAAERPESRGIASAYGGSYKTQAADFIVTECLNILPGKGEYLWLQIEKEGLDHRGMLRSIADDLSISVTDIGYCGTKDKRALTRQWVSVPKNICGLDGVSRKDLRIVTSKPAGRALRLGMHAGNDFRIKLRGGQGEIDPDALQAWVQSERFPNTFGPQRFGSKKSTLSQGLRGLRGGEKKRFSPAERFAQAALQAAIFHAVLLARIDEFADTPVLDGDIFWDTSLMCLRPQSPNEDVSSLQSCKNIYPTGPMLGKKCRAPRGLAKRLEDRAFNRLGLGVDEINFIEENYLGARRPLWFRATSFSLEKADDGLWVNFHLPNGCYASEFLSYVFGAKEFSALQGS